MHIETFCSVDQQIRAVVLVDGPRARAHGRGWAGFSLKPGLKAHVACA